MAGIVDIELDPADFPMPPNTIDNPYWPLIPGTSFGYRAIAEDECEFNRFTVTAATKTIEVSPGNYVEVRVIRDQEWVTERDEEGEPMGDPETEPATSGLIMLANPTSGDRYQQEFLEDEAEDWASVLRLNSRVAIEYGDFEDCLITKEWTPLEPGSVEKKFYCPAQNGFGGGLVFINELHGRTLYVEYVGGNFPAGLPGDGSVEFPAAELGCEE